MIRVQFQGSVFGICERKSGTEIGYIGARQLSAVRIIPTLLHVYPFIYHRRCKILAADSAFLNIQIGLNYI